jgi:hypothetical protein
VCEPWWDKVQALHRQHLLLLLLLKGPADALQLLA